MPNPQAPSGWEFQMVMESLREEFDAISKYQERIISSQVPSFLAIISHNLKEEQEHAVMLFKWLTENMPDWDTAGEEARIS